MANSPIRQNPSPPPVTQPRQPLGQERNGSQAIPGNNNGRAGEGAQRDSGALRGWLDKNRGQDFT